MNRELVNAAWHTLQEADHCRISVTDNQAISFIILNNFYSWSLVLLVIDAFRASTKSTYTEETMFDRLNRYNIPATLCFNKVFTYKMLFRFLWFIWSWSITSDNWAISQIDMLANQRDQDKLSQKYHHLYNNIKGTLFISALHLENVNELKVKNQKYIGYYYTN